MADSVDISAYRNDNNGRLHTKSLIIPDDFVFNFT